MKKEKKVIQKTVRMTEEVFSYVMKMGHQQFGRNLHEMIIFCMKREKSLYEQVQILERRKRELEIEIEEMEKKSVNTF